MVNFVLNGNPVDIDVPDDMPVLWVLRDRLGLTGTKYGCGIAQCGSCTIHVDGKAVRSCVSPAASLNGTSVVTIEGLAEDGELHPVQQAWIDEQVPQCGYCQPGLIMSVAAFLGEHPQPDDTAIDENITNICRCGTYPRIRKAIYRAARLGSGS
jgi:isoquinoline 1-oxidoreductase alpha subunit